MTLLDEQIPTPDYIHPENSSIQAISAFTFYISDTLFALRSDQVLSVNDDIEEIKILPVQGQGILGVYKYQGHMVPVFDYAKLIGVNSGQQIMTALIDNLEARERESMLNG
jgi:chemotaxis signal transduction protein